MKPFFHNIRNVQNNFKELDYKMNECEKIIEKFKLTKKIQQKSEKIKSLEEKVDQQEESKKQSDGMV